MNQNHPMKKKLFLVVILLALGACKTDKKTEVLNQKGEEIVIAETDNAWINLLEGSAADGWRAYNSESLPAQWIIKNGELSFDTEKKVESERKGGKDIVYGGEQFENFELVWEWKIPEGGNSGMLYHLQEGDWGPPEVSPEYQMLDDLKWEEINKATLEEWQKTGADYAMHIPDVSQKIIKPAMEWNSSRIIFTPDNVEHWLNGKKLLSFKPWTEDWEKRKSEGKWKDFPKYGTFKTGFICIQDHDSPIWLRNMKIKKL